MPPTKTTARRDVEPGLAQPGALIARVQAELIEAQIRREEAGYLPLFEVESLEIEMQVVLREVEDKSGKVDLRLFAVTADSQFEATQTHRVKLTLRATPEGPADSPSNGPSGRRPRVYRRE